MNEQPDDEELQQPRRRVPTAALTALAGAAVIGGALVAVTGGDERTPAPPPAPPTSTVPTPSPRPTTVEVPNPPAALLLAVTAAYPRAKLVEVGIAIPVRGSSDRNYQFISGGRRITVVVGPVDSRPEVQTSSERDVLVVAKRSGHRVVVSVRSFRGTLRPAELTTVRRLVRDTRLLATP